MIIDIKVARKFATPIGTPVIVCGNDDYIIHFTFDDEWEGLEYKTARFAYLQKGVVRYQDIVFEGDKVAVPALLNTREVLIGVFAGDLRTTTPARVVCEGSIRCGTGAPEDPTPSQYDQIMELLNRPGNSTAVLYTKQSLTDEEKAQARENIGVEGIESSTDRFDDMYAYAKQVQSAQSPTTLTLALMADTHYCDNDTDAKTKLDIAKTMGELSNYVNADVIANLGDMVRGDEDKATTQKDLAHLISSTNQNAKCPAFYLRGNHDDNGWYSYGDFGGEYKTDEILSEKEWYQTAFGFSRGDVVIDSNKPNGGYGYYDHNASKIRVFLLNTSDIPYVVEDDGTYRYNGYQCWAFSNEQLNFVANALKFEDKENPDEWAAMFLMHIPLDTTIADGYRFGAKHEFVRGNEEMLSIITAYKNGTSYKFKGTVQSSALGEPSDDFAVNIDVDYSGKGVGDVICFVNGHTHIDNASRKVGVENSLSHGYTYLSVFGDTAFATMVVDREKSVVTTFKYGEVTTISDRVDPQTGDIRDDYKGAINGEAELNLDMKTGVWEVPFDQFRPTYENLYNGLSELYGNGYFIDPAATLDTTTLELDKATANEKYKLTKGVAVKPSTEYVIPLHSGINVYFYRVIAGNTISGTPSTATNTKITEGENCKIIATNDFAGSGYLVFAFHSSYTDYENFYIREQTPSN